MSVKSFLIFQRLERETSLPIFETRLAARSNQIKHICIRNWRMHINMNKTVDKTSAQEKMRNKILI